MPTFVFIGAGDRERTFWRNYFFHCAFTRYEAGLSIDEIWSDQPAILFSGVAHVDDELHAEETVTFEVQENYSANESVASSTAGRAPLFDTNITTEEETAGRATESTSSGSNEGADYEMVGVADGDTDLAELDELEAEIARELED